MKNSKSFLFGLVSILFLGGSLGVDQLSKEKLISWGVNFANLDQVLPSIVFVLFSMGVLSALFSLVDFVGNSGQKFLRVKSYTLASVFVFLLSGTVYLSHFHEMKPTQKEVVFESSSIQSYWTASIESAKEAWNKLVKK